jgi:hypothetical protein
MMDRWDRVTDYCCGSCAYFSPKAFRKEGRCRRHSPTLGGYPVVFPDTDWCGDHKIGTNPDKVPYKVLTSESKQEICNTGGSLPPSMTAKSKAKR